MPSQSIAKTDGLVDVWWPFLIFVCVLWGGVRKGSHVRKCWLKHIQRSDTQKSPKFSVTSTRRATGAARDSQERRILETFGLQGLVFSDSSNPKVSPNCRNFRFPGRGQRNTPIITDVSNERFGSIKPLLMIIPKTQARHEHIQPLL